MGGILYTGTVYALYAQVALFDAEDKDAYPQWETGNEDAVLGSCGIAVATANDVEIQITVYKGKRKLEGIFCISGEIQVGSQGLIVGNIISNNFVKLPWPPGSASVDVYVNGQGAEVTEVVFVLDEKVIT